MSSGFYGVGWSFPVWHDSAGAIALSAEEESIRESILLIVGTARGERAMRPTFGSGLNQLVFEINDTMTAARASAEVRDSLIEWEPRIEVLDVRAGAGGDDANLLLIELDYRVRSTNNVFNLVYPFYLQTGTARS
jgi:phage baseplate assembly protein W